MPPLPLHPILRRAVPAVRRAPAPWARVAPASQRWYHSRLEERTHQLLVLPHTHADYFLHVERVLSQVPPTDRTFSVEPRIMLNMMDKWARAERAAFGGTQHGLSGLDEFRAKINVRQAENTRRFRAGTMAVLRAGGQGRVRAVWGLFREWFRLRRGYRREFKQFRKFWTMVTRQMDYFLRLQYGVSGSGLERLRGKAQMEGSGTRTTGKQSLNTVIWQRVKEELMPGVKGVFLPSGPGLVQKEAEKLLPAKKAVVVKEPVVKKGEVKKVVVRKASAKKAGAKAK